MSDGWMTGRVVEAAVKHAAGRIIPLLEGGYNPEAPPERTAAHPAALCGNINAKLKVKR